MTKKITDQIDIKYLLRIGKNNALRNDKLYVHEYNT